LNGVLIPKQGM